MAGRDFKVIIAGGSVAGLSLANMLEKHGIDYILLEAYGQIAPNIGASLALFPNGMRILDQLGCFEAVSKLGIPPFQGQHMLDAEGESMTVDYGMAEHFQRRYGYLGGFVDRQQVIQILYDNLQHKDRILVNKRVELVDMAGNNATVTTKDGDTFTGDLVVGADGIHSKIRQQMWRVANDIEPATFEMEESEVPCYFKCIFGISKPGTMPEDMSSGYVLAKKSTILIAQGAGRRAYFFLFVPVSPDGPKFGDDIPRYTKEDEATLVEEHWDVPIVRGKLTFGDLYKARTISTLVPLQEHVYKKWYYGRIMTIGDAAHKQDPIGGQGGNGAMETAAVLTNSLLTMLDQHHDHPSTQQIEAALAKTQELRYERATSLMNLAHSMQGILWKMKSPLGERVIRLFMSFMDPVTQSNLFGASVVEGPSLDGVPVPRRPRAVPYTDELPSQPVKGSLAYWLPATFSAILLVLLVLLRTATSSPSDIAMVERPLSRLADEWLSTPSTGDLPVGIPTVLLPLSRYFGSGQYRVAMFAPVFIVWFVESHRIGNRLSPMSLMVMVGALSQLLGITRVAPFYYIMSIFTGSNTIVGRRVPDDVVYTIIPAIVLGHAVLDRTLPLLCNAMAWSHLKDLSWLLVPAYCKLIHRWIKVSWVGKSTEDVKAPKGSEALSAYSITDASLLRKTYAATFAVSALIHLGLIGRFVCGSGLNLSTVLITPSMLRDIIFHGLLLAVYLVYTAWDMRRLGYITTVESVKMIAAVTVGQLLVGPGATYIGMWYWREGILTRLHVGLEEVAEWKTGAKA